MSVEELAKFSASQTSYIHKLIMRTCELEHALQIALRQWEAYASDHSSRELLTDDSAEGEQYRKCHQTYKAGGPK